MELRYFKDESGRTANIRGKEDVDVFLLQETKISPKDRTPVIPGYSSIRKDRIMTRNDENRRGGGLVTYVKDTLPYKEVRSEPNNGGITELLGTEIIISNRRKLQVWNVC